MQRDSSGVRTAVRRGQATEPVSAAPPTRRASADREPKAPRRRPPRPSPPVPARWPAECPTRAEARFPQASPWVSRPKSAGRARPSPAPPSPAPSVSKAERRASFVSYAEPAAPASHSRRVGAEWMRSSSAPGVAVAVALALGMAGQAQAAVVVVAARVVLAWGQAWAEAVSGRGPRPCSRRSRHLSWRAAKTAARSAPPSTQKQGHRGQEARRPSTSREIESAAGRRRLQVSSHLDVPGRASRPERDKDCPQCESHLRVAHCSPPQIFRKARRNLGHAPRAGERASACARES